MSDCPHAIPYLTGYDCALCGATPEQMSPDPEQFQRQVCEAHMWVDKNEPDLAATGQPMSLQGIEALSRKEQREDNLLCHLYQVLCSDLPSCGCGDPQSSHQLVYDLLRLAPFYEDGRWQRAERLIGTDGAFQIVIAALTKANLLEHGSSIGGSWITDRGKWVLWAIGEVGGIDRLDAKLDFAGFPHEWDRETQAMQPCTDACWRLPDGWEAAPEPKTAPEPAVPAAVPCPGGSCQIGRASCRERV